MNAEWNYASGLVLQRLNEVSTADKVTGNMNELNRRKVLQPLNELSKQISIIYREWN